MVSYNLADEINKLTNCEDLNDVCINLKVTAKIQRSERNNEREYTIIRYNKECLEKTKEDIATTGRFRSVILEKDNIMSFAPPKSIGFDIFQDMFLSKDCYAREFIEGTMINLFYDKSLPEDDDFGFWEISTRSSVGGNIRFYSSSTQHRDNPGKTFREMFLEALNNNTNSTFKTPKELLNFLPTNWCYSLVLQHPENRIVTPFSETNIYLVQLYEIDNSSKIITHHDFTDEVNNWIFRDMPWLKLPTTFTGVSYDELKNDWASDNTDYSTPGIMIFHKETEIRTKIRNPNYEKIRKLRGNQPKLQFHYLTMRQSEGVVDDINTYLKYYPEDTNSFKKYKKQIDIFSKNLHNYYLSCHVHKKISHNLLPFEFKNHIYELHGLYLKGKIDRVTKSVVEKYINELPAARLMFSINYNNSSLET